MSTKQVTLKLSYDPEVDAAYLYLTEVQDEAVKATYTIDDASDSLSGDLNIDTDGSSRVLGFEILYASEHLPESLLSQIKG